MNSQPQPKPAHWWSAEMFSPKDFVRHAVLILLVFGIVHLLDLRDYTSVLNGTPGATGMDPTNAALLGILYVLCYLAAILAAPIFFLTAGFLVVWKKFKTSLQSSS